MTDLSASHGLRVTAADIDQVLVETLRELNEHGADVGRGQGRGSSRECLDFTVELTNLRDRVPVNPDASFDLTVAVARFVWMVSGDDRLADIHFYEQAVTRFSDNQISVPGSNYGTRLFQPRPGLNQIEGVIGRIRADTDTRRAAAVVWGPEDALRNGPGGERTNDIPCAFGLMFHVRDGSLHTQLKMRSNNAFQLLPVNLFEFGMLAELVAVETDTELGPLYSNAASMHLYEDGRARWEAASRFDPAASVRWPMPAMPSNALEQAYVLARKEAQLRHELHQVAREDIPALQARCDGLNPWWADLYRLLLSHALVKVGRYRTAVAIVKELDRSLVDGGLAHLERIRKRAPEERAERLFETEGDTVDPVAEAVSQSWDLAEREQALSTLQAVLHEIEQSTEIPLLHAEYRTLAREMIDERRPLAARSGEDPAARFGIGRSEVEARLRRLRDDPQRT